MPSFKPILQPSPTANLLATAQNLLALLGVRVSKTALAEELGNHPAYPSLSALSDSLRLWGVESMAVRLPREELAEVPFPAVAQIGRSRGHIFVVLQSFDGSTVQYIDPEVGYAEETYTDFCKQWTGALLMVEVGTQAGEKNYAQNRKKEILNSLRLPFVIVGLAVLLSLAVWSVGSLASLAWCSLLTVHVVGVAVSVLLLIAYIDKENAFTLSLCNLKENLDCSSVLSSHAATLFGVVSWAEIGFFYFTGGLLVTLTKFETLSMLLYFSCVFALPYTLFSIYYQGVVLKKWCVLCLSVQVLLWAEFGIFFFSGVNLSAAVHYVSMPQIFWVLAAFALPVLLWVLVKPAFLALQERKALRKNLAKFQRNGVIFEAFLQAQKRVQVGRFSEEFILGNAEAPLTLTIFTNPYCAPCGVAHHQLEDLLSDFQEDIKVVVRFAINPNLAHARNQIVKHLLYLYKYEGQTKASEALASWYAQNKKEYTAWAKKFPATFGEDMKGLLEEHLAWSSSADIEATPTVFVEGQQLSHPYQILDLKYFIKNMTPTYA